MADRWEMQNTKSMSGKHILDEGVNGQGIQDPIEPGSNDIDERTTQDYKTAIERSRAFGGDRLRHAKPNTTKGYEESSDEEDIDISWRPDPSGHPRRTF
ncbi:uncharacterized protein N7511_008142 [Penicillium nucicola]|uniref:uncharacterized protein n=1 Tax=Penicillium nucicola TaxID=1850975 RepID=UPI002545AC2B|nr:uncharacterized protein N7511_008142 [Penicillium nucicola]KAJ5753989.1 hypothetical protein N7511_008142 [Penicillium nucicola]